jgi:hypothetical protein
MMKTSDRLEQIHVRIRLSYYYNEKDVSESEHTIAVSIGA